MEYYWELVQHDGTTLDIPPSMVDTIKAKLTAGEIIHTKSMSIPTNQVKNFRISNKPFSDTPLLEAVSQAFNEPIFNEDGSIQARWVKKEVPQRIWAKMYRGIPAYKVLEAGTMMTIAFALPTHDIDLRKVAYCTDDEIRQLTH